MLAAEDITKLRFDQSRLLRTAESGPLDPSAILECRVLLQELVRSLLLREAKQLAEAVNLKLPAQIILQDKDLTLVIVEALAYGATQSHAKDLLSQLDRGAYLSDPRLLADLCLVESKILYQGGNGGEAKKLADRAYQTAMGRGDFDGLGRAAQLLGMCSLRIGRSAEAEQHFQDAAVFSRMSGRRLRQAMAEANQGICLKNQLEWAAADLVLRRASSAAESLGANNILGYTKLTQAVIAYKAQHVGDAIKLVPQAVQAFQEVANPVNDVSCNLLLAQCHILTGEHTLARRELTTAFEIATEHGYAREEALAHEFTGDLLLEQGSAKEALQHYDSALKIGLRTAPRGDVVVEAQRRRAEALIPLGLLEDAERALDQGEEIAKAIPEPYELAVMSRVRLQLVASHGNKRETEKAYRKARQMVWAMDEKVQRGRLLETWATILLAWDESALRREALYEARNFYGAAGAQGCFQRITEALEFEKLEAGRKDAKPRLRYGMVVAHPSTARTLDQLERYRESRLPILIMGETGTGKELIARAVHEMRGGEGPWVAVNCGAMPRELIESELFGAAKGAYTGAISDRPGVFERANGGTLFLDEVGELPLSAQTRLLRVLETGEVTRIGEGLTRKVKLHLVAATHRDLRAGVKEGWFRSDLYYRLEGLVVELLPLRERREETEHLGRHFMALLEHEIGRSIPVDDSFWTALRSREWPGNVRQLKRAVERAALGLLPGQMLQEEHLTEPRAESHQRLDEDREEFEREKIVRALTRSDWSKTGAAAILGVKRTTLIGIMKRLSIPMKKEG